MIRFPRLPFFILALGFSALFPSEKTRIAVLPVEAKAGVDPSVALAVSDLLAQELVSLRKFTVVERSRLQQVLKEQALQQSGCTEQSCAVKLGNLLNVQKIAAGSVTRLGSKHIIAVNLIDVERGQVELGEKFSVDAVEDILQNVNVLAARLGERAQVFGILMKQSDGITWLVNLGLNDGVRAGQKLPSVRYGKAIVNQNTGELMGRETRDLGELTVVRVDPSGEFSTVKPSSLDVKEGDRVYLPANGKSQEYTSTTPSRPAAISRAPKAAVSPSTALEELQALRNLEAMIKSRQFMKEDQRLAAQTLARHLPETTRLTLLSQKQMSPAGYFAANFFIFSLGSWIQGDRVAGAVILGGIVLGSAFATLGSLDSNEGIIAIGSAFFLTAAVANYGGPFIYANQFNKALRESLQGARRTLPSEPVAVREARFLLPIFQAAF
ncbi:MAG: hypothetical protein J0L75_08125 [Spirochaetes bacterium]|nr:hypothetical protein [Spirochaetota bacterium]